ncbi:Response regulator receiver domain-containing protein [Desulfatibacillum alkenivorans DSM 16219]|uniref:Response regulator receiver domain-containing protein n=1 Tax=Desulfatibacillum alkenivorans DSM 16219 TaxID=1121393 RepID=A0A1M6XK02_9BACT|nr:response regulator [Desulfatibacillum alkenivorans]SHL06226.1 Response regulator receiver domain-containing protein [Desulfatibacillum alkenivorans DSM 16219]
MLGPGITICVADPNPRVRELLRREFSSLGCNVEMAGAAQEVVDKCLSDHPPDLLVLDPEISRADSSPILSRISMFMPGLPVVLHAFPGEALNHPAAHKAAAILEKGESTHRLRDVVSRILNERSAASGAN